MAFEDAFSGVERTLSGRASGPFWRKKNPIIVDGLVAVGGMFPPQREWWRLPNFIKLLVGGYGCGKTMIGAKRIIANALQNAPCPVAAVSPSFPIARRTTIEKITELLSGKRTVLGKAFWWRYNKTSHEFSIKYHGRVATVIIYSADNPEALVGSNLASAWLDEPFLMDEFAFKQMIARVRHPNAVKHEILLTGTPEQLNWGWDIVEGEQAGRYDVGMVRASTRENPALPPDYVEHLLGAFDGKAAEAYVEGKFVNLSLGIVYYAFDPGVHVRDLPIPDNAELGVGMDFNVNPMACIAFWRAGAHIHFFDEFEFPNADTEYVCQVLREKYVEGREGKTKLANIYPDATGSARKTSAPGGKTDFHYIREAGFSVCAPHANPKRRDRYNAVNGKLKPASGAEAALTISPKCRKLRKYLSTYSHEEMLQQESMSHLLDAFGYPISYLFPVKPEDVQVRTLSGV